MTETERDTTSSLDELLTDAEPEQDREGEREQAPVRGRAARRHLWTLMYHSVTVTPADPYNITVTPDRLRTQLGWLRKRGLRGVSAAELLAAHDAGDPSGLVALTFDDGYTDFTRHAVPLLRQHGFTATVFVLPGRLGGENEWDELGPRKELLDEAGILAAAEAGMEIGSHGLLHRALPDLDEDTLRAETAGSRERLAELTGQDITGFCYPYGTIDQRSVDAVREAGYAYACAIDPGPLTGRHALPRVHVGQADGGARLRAKRLLHPLRRRPVEALPVVGDGQAPA
ncbi:polysaccharide deacetylase [Streptomyces xiamenensis]|uniref:Polysaccharide deacetylase n=2 Tax=Streptomyces TaxID=1883 RepID=A0A0F7FUF3_9ACTN|nr:polysaccharide deacetylase [Streptomyces xiamenensis]